MPDNTTYNELERKGSLEVQNFLFGKYKTWRDTPEMTLAEMRLLSSLPPTLTFSQLLTDCSEKVKSLLSKTCRMWYQTPQKTLAEMRSATSSKTRPKKRHGILFTRVKSQMDIGSINGLL